MSRIHHDDISIWVDDLTVLSPEFTVIPVWNTIQFFMLRGKTTTMCKENLEPIKDVWYSVKADDTYYIRRFRNYSVDELVFYRRTLTFSGQSDEIENLRRYIYDKNVHLLLNNEQMSEIHAKLEQVWKSHFVSPGKVQYKHFISLLEQNIQLADYQSYSLGLLGSKTVVSQFKGRIRAIWDEIYKNQVPLHA